MVGSGNWGKGRISNNGKNKKERKRKNERQ